MMKLLALQNASRRSNSFRAAAVIDGSVDGGIKSPAAFFWLVLHGFCCLISLVLGFRFSRLVLFILFSSASPNASTNSTTSTISSFDVSLTMPFLSTAKHAGAVSTTTGDSDSLVNKTLVNGGVSGSRVVVGRHGIRIRPWPHPNPEEVMKAHRILERVQREQWLQYGVKNARNLIVVTATYSRTFQALHLTGVMHSLMNAPYDVVWIVVEAGGVTNETASLIRKSGIQTLHIGFNRRMPITWADRHKMEDQMRLRALRVVREKKLDGIVMFADDSNMHTMELFDEVQKVNWIGAVSVGILVHSGGDDDTLQLEKTGNEDNPLPVQGPACNSSEVLVGWHTFNSSPYAEKSAVYIGDMGIVLPRKLEWAGFVLNSRLLWKDDVDKPDWVNDLDMLGEGNIESPLSLIKDPSVIEPLGSCGRKVLLWWLRVEARSDSKFPPRWIIDNPLEVTVPAKRSPWPDSPPELPAIMKVMTNEEHTEKRHLKNRTPRSKRSSQKRKHEVRSTETQDSSRQLGEN
ncbi:Probable beta-1,4-xylosyltransferase irx14h [Ancistrocladus abbreviatus]